MMFIFVRPNYMQLRCMFPDKSRFWALLRCLREPDVQAFASSHMTSAVAKGALSRPFSTASKQPGNSVLATPGNSRMLDLSEDSMAIEEDEQRQRRSVVQFACDVSEETPQIDLQAEPAPHVVPESAVRKMVDGNDSSSSLQASTKPVNWSFGDSEIDSEGED